MWDIKDNGNGTYNYNGMIYNNKDSAERQRQYDMYREDEYYRNLGKKNNTNQPGCLSTLVGIGGIALGIAFGLKGSREKAEKFMDSLKLATIATHVADAKTCLLHPASHTHRQLSDEQLAEAGVDKDLIRFSVGLEDADDIIEDP